MAGQHRGQPIKRELLHTLMPYDSRLRLRVAICLGLLVGIGGLATHWDKIKWPAIGLVFCLIHLETCRLLWSWAHSRGRHAWYTAGYADGELGRPRLIHNGKGA